MEYNEKLNDDLTKQAEAHKELLKLYDKDVTRGILRRMDPKVIFEGINFDDPLGHGDKKQKDGSPSQAPFKTFIELQKYLFLKPIEKNEEILFKVSQGDAHFSQKSQKNLDKLNEVLLQKIEEVMKQSNEKN